MQRCREVQVVQRGAEGCRGVQGARLGRVGDARVDRAVASALVGAARRDAHASGEGEG